MKDIKDDEMYLDEQWQHVSRSLGLGCKVCSLPNPDRGKSWSDDLCPEHHPDNYRG